MIGGPYTNMSLPGDTFGEIRDDSLVPGGNCDQLAPLDNKASSLPSIWTVELNTTTAPQHPKHCGAWLRFRVSTDGRSRSRISTVNSDTDRRLSISFHRT